MDNRDYVEGNKLSDPENYKVYNQERQGLLGEDTNRRVMTKVKPNRFCVNVQQNARSYVRYLAIVVLILVLSYFGFHYVQIDHQTVPILSSDRSEAYNVKILPNNLDDEQLNLLPKEAFSYLAMIDAGSSGCRAHVYRYGKLGNLNGPLYILPQHQSKKVKPGLSTFANNPDKAGSSLADLVAFVKTEVPEKDWEVTPIWLKATAGLRMLPSTQSDAILDSVRNFLINKQNSPFLFRTSWARIIPGNEEGGFGWIAYNYLQKLIGPKAAASSHTSKSTPSIPPYAVIEMGGASAQVSQLAPSLQVANLIPPEYRFSFTIEQNEYHLYTHSYLGYGAEQAREQFNKYLVSQNVSLESQNADPCQASGYVKTARRALQQQTTPPLQQTSTQPQQAVAGSETNNKNTNLLGKCVQQVTNLFSSTAPAPATCDPTKGPYSFKCVYQPDFVAQSANILTFENFYYLSSALGVQSVDAPTNTNGTNPTKPSFPLRTTPALIKAAHDTFCALPWSVIQQEYPKDNQSKDVNDKMCFLSGFAYDFLVTGLKIPPNKVITIQKEVSGSEIEWALGAAYKEAAGFLKRTNLRPT
jgi:Golgi nucleoside diphosphatase